MNTPWLQKSIDHNRENQNVLWQRSLDLGARATAWVLAANAAGLVFCFNAVLSGKLCDWDSLRLFGGVFLLGIAAAYLSVLCQQRSFEEFSTPLANFVAKGTAALGLLQQLDQIDGLSPEKKTPEMIELREKILGQFDAKKSELEHTDLTPKSAIRWMNWSNYLLAASCTALGAGVMSALWLFPQTALCPPT